MTTRSSAITTPAVIIIDIFILLIQVLYQAGIISSRLTHKGLLGLNVGDYAQPGPLLISPVHLGLGELQEDKECCLLQTSGSWYGQVNSEGGSGSVRCKSATPHILSSLNRFFVNESLLSKLC